MRVAQLLVAVRQAQLAGVEDLSRLHHAKTIARITAAISGDSKDFVAVWPKFPPKTVKNQQPVPARQRTRLRPGQCSTPSWPAAYNLACAYAALAEKADAKGQRHLIEKVVGSLEFTVCNPECEMERPSEWIGNDPDFSRLSGGRNDCFMEFLDDQWKRDYPVGG